MKTVSCVVSGFRRGVSFVFKNPAGPPAVLLKIGPIGCPETSVINIPEEQRSRDSIFLRTLSTQFPDTLQHVAINKDRQNMNLNGRLNHQKHQVVEEAVAMATVLQIQRWK
jgi:hypothetical protein